jgi:hypothetical protein
MVEMEQKRQAHEFAALIAIVCGPLMGAGAPYPLDLAGAVWVVLVLYCCCEAVVQGNRSPSLSIRVGGPWQAPKPSAREVDPSRGDRVW